MRQISICGEDVKIGFSMAVELAYEEATKEAFDINQLVKQTNSMALGMAAISTYNPETRLTVEQIAMNASAEEIKALNDAVVAEMLAWLKIPTVAEQESAADSEEADGKN